MKLNIIFLLLLSDTKAKKIKDNQKSFHTHTNSNYSNVYHNTSRKNDEYGTNTSAVNVVQSHAKIVPLHINEPKSSKSHLKQKLLDGFKFKGFAISFIKSLVNIKSMGLGIKVPITPNFPNYDRVLHFPRVGAFVGIYYPATVRISLSFSLPMQIIIIKLLLLTTSKEFVAPVKAYFKKSDSVKRVGVSLSYRMDRLLNYRFAIGPSIIYNPGTSTMKKILPFLVIPPSILITIFDLLTKVFFLLTSYLVQKTNVNIVQLDDALIVANATIDSTLQTYSLNETAVEFIPTPTGKPDSQTVESLPSSSFSLLNVIWTHIHQVNEFIGFIKWWKQLLQWTDQKTTGFVYNVGYFSSHHLQHESYSNIGSNLQFDIAPFYTPSISQLRQMISQGFHWIISRVNSDEIIATSKIHSKASRNHTYDQVTSYQNATLDRHDVLDAVVLDIHSNRSTKNPMDQATVLDPKLSADVVT